MRKVDFICVGAAKSGTSALDKYLQLHPSVSTARGKSTRYFNRHHHKGDEWYHEFFNPEKPVWGECTFGYGVHDPSLVAIDKYKPDIPLWLLVRNPVDRLVSHLWWEHEPIGLLTKQEVGQALAGGQLHRQKLLWHSDTGGTVRRIAKFVPRCTLRLIPSGVLYRQPKETVNCLFETLGLQPLAELEPLIVNEKQYRKITEREQERTAKRFNNWRTNLTNSIANASIKIKVLTEDFTWDDNITTWTDQATVSK